ncbi:hypothetical protein [Schinkia azotoformans]|nr:hypothetical protein [Schinkia azotoformans]MEC1772312.1 hypothetical protein [Schinkia azotoformans]MED4367053.1 hypothetical protein [Schinkia azotoformans]
MGKEIKFADDCTYKKGENKELLQDLITILFVQYVNDKYGYEVIVKNERY